MLIHFFNFIKASRVVNILSSKKQKVLRFHFEKVFICVLKIKEGLVVLELHEDK